MSTQQLDRAERIVAPEWAGMTWLRAGTELLLGLSFLVTVGFGFAGVVAGETSIVAQLSAIVFVCSLAAVLVNWFTATTDDSHRRGWES